MLNAELELGNIISELEEVKMLSDSSTYKEAIKKIQLMSAFDCRTEISILDIQIESDLIVDFINHAVSEDHLSTSLALQLKVDIENVFILIAQIKEGLDNIHNRPPLEHIDNYCRSNIAVAYSFVERWKDGNRSETHGSLCDLSLYTVNSEDNKDEVFDPNFGLVTLKLIEHELAILETFECLNLHPNLARKSKDLT